MAIRVNAATDNTYTIIGLKATAIMAGMGDLGRNPASLQKQRIQGRTQCVSVIDIRIRIRHVKRPQSSIGMMAEHECETLKQAHTSHNPRNHRPISL